MKCRLGFAFLLTVLFLGCSNDQSTLSNDGTESSRFVLQLPTLAVEMGFPIEYSVCSKGEILDHVDQFSICTSSNAYQSLEFVVAAYAPGSELPWGLGSEPITAVRDRLKEQFGGAEGVEDVSLRSIDGLQGIVIVRLDPQGLTHELWLPLAGGRLLTLFARGDPASISRDTQESIFEAIIGEIEF